MWDDVTRLLHDASSASRTDTRERALPSPGRLMMGRGAATLRFDSDRWRDYDSTHAIASGRNRAHARPDERGRA